MWLLAFGSTPIKQSQKADQAPKRDNVGHHRVAREKLTIRKNPAAAPGHGMVIREHSLKGIPRWQKCKRYDA